MKMKIKSYLDKKETNVIDIHHGDFFLEIGSKEYRVSADAEGNLTFTLINGQNMQVTVSNGYPAVKIIGKNKLESE